MKLKPRYIRTRAGDIYRKLAADNVTGDAAMMAFILIFSMLAFLLLVVFIVGQFFSDPAAVTTLLDELDRLFPGVAREDLNDLIDGIRSSAGRAGFIALIALLWTGSSFWSTINHSLNKIYAVKNRSFLRRRLQGVLVTLLLVLFFFLVIVLSGAVGFSASDGEDLPFGLSRVPGSVTYLSLFATWAISSALLVFIYGVGPNTRVGWHEIWPGALLAALLVTVLSLAFPAYVTSFDLSRYGAVFGFVVLVLTWLYFISLIILTGAELNSMRHGSHWKSEI